jgi:8-oxo-dGTP diphosphatase
MFIHVACAIIEENGWVLAAQRNESGRMPLKWEFPGGKIHEGESPEECLKREVMEEMGARLEIKRALPPASHDYADFSVTLYPFVCSLVTKEITLHEHKAIKWLLPEELLTLDWAEADIPIIKGYLEGIDSGVTEKNGRCCP